MKNIILFFTLILATPSDLFASKAFDTNSISVLMKKKKKGLFKSKKKCKCPKIK